jgi:hypothetical protein
MKGCCGSFGDGKPLEIVKIRIERTVEESTQMLDATTPATRSDALNRTSRRAVLYALRELGRRAGATAAWIAQWRVEFLDRELLLFPQPGSERRISLPCDPSKPARLASLISLPPSRHRWMHEPHADRLDAIPDFAVHFEDRARSAAPLFTETGHDEIRCCADIVTATLWHLTRIEEVEPVDRDEHGRFPAKASVAYRSGCLERPLVDEFGLALQQALRHLLPGWEPQPARLRVKLSHDMDLIGFPRRLRATLAHLYPRWMPAAFAQDLFSAAGIGMPARLSSVLRVAEISSERELGSAFYWTAAGVATPNDAGYDIFQPQIRAVVERLAERGCEIGLHPAYESFDSQPALDHEVTRLRRLVGTQPIGGRQHYLRWHPRSWRYWERAGLSYDSTLGFADAIGFRAGTAVPYHPWLLDEDRESTLLEIPLVVMDRTPVTYMRLDRDEIEERIAALIRRCSSTGGVFTLLWHNHNVVEEPYASLYPRILDMLPPGQEYDWKADVALTLLPLAVGGEAIA